jgi:hypothetical protein
MQVALAEGLTKTSSVTKGGLSGYSDQVTKDPSSKSIWQLFPPQASGPGVGNGLLAAQLDSEELVAGVPTGDVPEKIETGVPGEADADTLLPLPGELEPGVTLALEPEPGVLEPDPTVPLAPEPDTAFTVTPVGELVDKIVDLE